MAERRRASALSLDFYVDQVQSRSPAAAYKVTVTVIHVHAHSHSHSHGYFIKILRGKSQTGSPQPLGSQPLRSDLVHLANLNSGAIPGYWR
jgi:hypothetical protein